MNTVNLQVITNPSLYNQNTQTSDIEFSLLNRDGGGFKELHYQVRCREYLGDCVVASYVDRNTPRIYGFELVNKRAAIDETLLSITGSQITLERVIRKLKVIIDLEKQIGLKEDEYTQIYGTQFSDKLVIVGNKVWMSSPVMISLYTLVIRCLTYDTRCVKVVNLLKEISKKYGIAVDGTQLYRIFNNYLFDFPFFFANWRDILGDNPLTGLNDDQFTHWVSNGSYIDSYELDYDSGCILWNIDECHSYTGIAHMSRKAYLLKNNKDLYETTHPGLTWARNYLALKETNG